MSSRESDSPYPSPRQGGPGRRPEGSPDAYPSGTPPYGTGLPNGFGAPGLPEDGPQGSALGGADEDVPRTETTLTTRVRINIPGSRPIPPVVVRSTVRNEEPPAEPSGPRHRSAAASSPVLGMVDPAARTATPPNLPKEWEQAEPATPSSSESTGEWFKPRQRTQGGPAPVPAAAGAQRPAAAQPQQPQQPAAPVPTGAPATPFGDTGSMPLPGDPYAAAPQREGRPGRGANPFAGPADSQGGAGRGADPYGNDPFATRPTQGGNNGSNNGNGGNPFADRPAAAGVDATRALRMPRPPQGQGEPEDTQIGGFEPIQDDFPPQGAIPGLPTANSFGSARQAPADPFATGTRRPGPAAPADPFGTADPFATAAPKAPQGRFADVSYEPAPPFPGNLGSAAPQGPVPPVEIVPEPEPDVDDEPAAAPRRRSRAPKLAAYAVGGLLFAGAAAYGTGLMLNQADIPEGTTVLGTDIGGDARDQALSLLDGSVGKAGQRAVKLKIGAQTVDLDPTAAGLSFDTTATVDALTSHSYNPVDVISSLSGSSKAVAPEVKVDRAKLKAALDAVGAKSGQGLQEGFVRFTPDGQTEIVPGKAGQTVDAAAALDQVEQAYRDRAAGKDDTVLTVPVTAAQPKISADALKAAADTLGKPVLTGPVTVTAGTKKFEFTKAVAADVLTIAPDASGKLALTWDYDKLGGALKGVFDKSKTKGKAITPQDVADGITSVLDKPVKERSFKFPA
ncbi:peptidoglycan binding domain-containing protein [Kitasatospora sp. McL0602]|uniref:peptidoglycan binding domain-containing protein n=1 Tax=Kitasatospora sp. McL0602 TaxID=3439530 RepID=UPI003F8B0629